MIRRLVTSTLFLLGLILLSGPGARAQFGIPGADKVTKLAEAQKPWTKEEEQAIGNASAAKLIAVFGLYEEPRAVKYVQLVGESVAQYAPRRDVDYRFAILDTDIVNAFATPDSYVFVTRGLLANLEDEAELAGVLGHEIIHGSERHLEKELRDRKTAAIGYEEGTSRIPVAEAAKFGNVIADTLLTGKLSRNKEHEADNMGLELVAQVGYDPQAYVDFMTWLGNASGQGSNQQGLGILTASHPKYADRVKRMQEHIKKKGWDKQEWPRLAERYQANMVFGAEAEDAPATGAPEEGAAAPGEAAPSGTPAPAAAATGGTTPASPTESGSPGSLSFPPFSADQIVSQGGQVQSRGRVYMHGKRYRMEMEQQGQQSIVIMRYDRQVMWMLMPAQNTYMEMPLQEGRSMMDAAQDPGSKMERELLGQEKVGPYNCDKYRVRVTSGGGTWTGIHWSAPELKDFVVKMLDEGSNTVIEYQDISLAPPDPALFELPPGYRKMTY